MNIVCPPRLQHMRSKEEGQIVASRLAWTEYLEGPDQQDFDIAVIKSIFAFYLRSHFGAQLAKSFLAIGFQLQLPDDNVPTSCYLAGGNEWADRNEKRRESPSIRLAN